MTLATRASRLPLTLAVAGLTASLQPASAQNTGQVAGASGLVVIDGSPPPVAPASITRDEAGRATVRGSYQFGPQRPVAGTVSLQVGDLEVTKDATLEGGQRYAPPGSDGHG